MAEKMLALAAEQLGFLGMRLCDDRSRVHAGHYS